MAKSWSLTILYRTDTSKVCYRASQPVEHSLTYISPESHDICRGRRVNDKTTFLSCLHILTVTVSCTQPVLKQIFSEYGRVQSCIVSSVKHHAFVKMSSRRDAVAAKEGLDAKGGKALRGYMRSVSLLYTHPRKTEVAKSPQTQWGIGFGARDYCDVATGVSVIPLDKLRSIDLKCLRDGGNGGTRGKPVVSKMVVVEPDFEPVMSISSMSQSRRSSSDASEGQIGVNQGRDNGGREHRHGGHYVQGPSLTTVNTIPLPPRSSPQPPLEALSNGFPPVAPPFGCLPFPLVWPQGFPPPPPPPSAN